MSRRAVPIVGQQYEPYAGGVLGRQIMFGGLSLALSACSILPGASPPPLMTLTYYVENRSHHTIKYGLVQSNGASSGILDPCTGILHEDQRLQPGTTVSVNGTVVWQFNDVLPAGMQGLHVTVGGDGRVLAQATPDIPTEPLRPNRCLGDG
jgi:hypothetical protein